MNMPPCIRFGVTLHDDRMLNDVAHMHQRRMQSGRRCVVENGSAASWVDVGAPGGKGVMKLPPKAI